MLCLLFGFLSGLCVASRPFKCESADPRNTESSLLDTEDLAPTTRLRLHAPHKTVTVRHIFVHAHDGGLGLIPAREPPSEDHVPLWGYLDREARCDCPSFDKPPV